MSLDKLNSLLRDKEAIIWRCPYCGTLVITDNVENYRKLKKTHLTVCKEETNKQTTETREKPQGGFFTCRKCGKQVIYFGKRPKRLGNLCIPCYEKEKKKKWFEE